MLLGDGQSPIIRKFISSVLNEFGDQILFFEPSDKDVFGSTLHYGSYSSYALLVFGNYTNELYVPTNHNESGLVVYDEAGWKVYWKTLNLYDPNSIKETFDNIRARIEFLDSYLRSKSTDVSTWKNL